MADVADEAEEERVAAGAQAVSADTAEAPEQTDKGEAKKSAGTQWRR